MALQTYIFVQFALIDLHMPFPSSKQQRHWLSFADTIIPEKPASVTQSDARPTGDQLAADSILTWSGNNLSWRLIRK